METKLIQNLSESLIWLKNHPQALRGIKRGIEREALRINSDGSLAKTNHPKQLGSVLTHRWITTDFSESSLEFITPAYTNLDYMITIMRDIHRYTARILNNERMWPLSIPCFIENEKDIQLAQYGDSNIGRLKTLYRRGLKNRYGALMQMISGVHYNFSFPKIFWKFKYNKVNKKSISDGYLCLIRNYYRFGWVIPYLFGASPAIFPSFLKKKYVSIPFKKTNCNIYYLPYATSLRLSDIGYNNNLQSNLGITFNELDEYIAGLKRAIKTSWIEYETLGIEKEGKRLQINSNILQIENELYTPIRPKRATENNEAISDALLRSGIEYIEIRSLDINPFSPIGIDEQQVRFLDMFMVWCILVESPKMSSEDLFYSRINWNRIILEGRKPGLTLNLSKDTNQCSLLRIGQYLFRDLSDIAEVFDYIFGGKLYQSVCKELIKYFDDQELTFSARILKYMVDMGIQNTGCLLSSAYHSILQDEPLTILTENDFNIERDKSIKRQNYIESKDNEPFLVFLKKKLININ